MGGCGAGGEEKNRRFKKIEIFVNGSEIDCDATTPVVTVVAGNVTVWS